MINLEFENSGKLNTNFHFKLNLTLPEGVTYFVVEVLTHLLLSIEFLQIILFEAPQSTKTLM